eukprot:sb/3477070/
MPKITMKLTSYALTIVCVAHQKLVSVTQLVEVVGGTRCDTKGPRRMICARGCRQNPPHRDQVNRRSNVDATRICLNNTLSLIFFSLSISLYLSISLPCIFDCHACGIILFA